MARRARFGRLPRVGRDLTSEIVSIAREMNNREDANLMDAWQKGGTFNGEKATDEAVLAHWRERLKGVADDDPLADTYRNAVTQYDYSIHESKQSVLYAQGKINDAQMAQFYLGWAKKVPKNSEFYRVLQRDAAQFMRAAKAKGAAAAAKAKEEAYLKAQDGTRKTYEGVGEYLTDTLRTMAQQGAFIGGPGGNSDFTDFDPNDPDRMLKLLDAISVQQRLGGAGLKGETPSQEVLFHDPITGKAVTGATIADQLHKLDPHFDGRVNMTYLQSALKRQMQGLQIRLDRADTTGHAQDVNALKKGQSYMAEIGREANAWPIEQDYMNLRQQFAQTWASKTATPDQKLAAWKEYQAGLVGLASSTSRVPDDNTKNRLLAEANGDAGIATLAESFTGLQAPDQGVVGIDKSNVDDIASTQADVARYTAMQEAVATGAGAWTTGITKGGVFVPQAGGPEIGAASLHDIQQVSPVAPQIVYVPQGSGSAVPVVVTGAEVKVSASDATGAPIANLTNQNPVASVYDVTINGQKTRVFGYKAGDGRTYYSTDTPWNDRLPVRDTNGGLVIDVSAFVPQKGADGTFGQLNPGFELSPPNREGKRDLVMDPGTVALTSDPARTAAGPDPASDFFSPTLAVLMSSPDGQRTLSVLKDDPGFQAQIATEAQRAAIDPKTGQIDQSVLGRYNTQVQLVTHAPESRSDFLTQVGKMFDKVSTMTTFATTQAAQEKANGGPIDRNLDSGRMPTDALHGTAFEALGAVFQPFTNLFKQPSSSEPGKGLSIQTSGTITVPQAPTPTTPAVAPIPTTTPVAPSAPVQVAPGPTQAAPRAPKPTAGTGGYGRRPI